MRQVLEQLPTYPSLNVAAEAIARREGLAEETARRWVVQAPIDGGQRQDATSGELVENKDVRHRSAGSRKDTRSAQGLAPRGETRPENR